MNDEKLLQVNGVDICVQTFGDPIDPTVLLIGGMNASMDWWEPDFCERLAGAGRFVIRYDHRDTGRSVSYPAGAPGYRSDDLVADAAGVLAALGRPSGHVVGISMGGALAQLLALDRPGIVDSLTLISTTAGAGDADLPSISPELSAQFTDPPSEPDWSDPAAVVDYIVAGTLPYAARTLPFDGAAVRAVAERAVARTDNLAASQLNHALIEGGGSWRARLGEIGVPTLVIHGTEDPLFPYGHGEALAREIHGAQLLPLERTGHELPRRVWESMIPAILAITTPDWPERADLLAASSVAAGEPTAWFERLYSGARRGQSAIPWDRESANPLLVEWLRDHPGADRRAVVVGCGLGIDAEYVAAQGFETDAFDISATAIGIAQDRRPNSPVRYRAADALNLPAEWRRAFDLVVEIYTVQALPLTLRADIIAAIAGLVAVGGRLIAIQVARQEIDEPPGGPPWPLHRSEIDAFGVEGLQPVSIELISTPGSWERWRVEFTRPA